MKLLLGLALAVATGTTVAGDLTEIEQRRLFSPTEDELRAEATGRIYIYDGLSESDIARAMNQEFERVESMMFIRVKKTDEHGQIVTDPETGEPVVEDDGC
jgi:hypothetical protein